MKALIGYLNAFLVINLATILASINTNAQYTETGQEPSKIKWRQINTQNIKLIYDSNFEKEAQRIAAIFDYSSTLTGNTLHQAPKKIPILIHNHSAESNGMVVWAPKRMELFSVPPQDMYPQGWFEQLAVHESRHVAQMNRLTKQSHNFLYYLLGEFNTGINAAEAPTWLLEGDAVISETVLSNAGRGRLPSFEMGYRTMMLENQKPYNFRKAFFGSFKDYVPDYYELGYLMVAYNRVKYGPELWETAFNNISNENLFPVLNAIKSKTGLNRKTFYKQTFAELDSLWKQKSNELTYSSFKNLNKTNKKAYTSYQFGIIYKNSLIAIKSGIDDIARIVSVDTTTKKETILVTPGQIMTNSLSTANDRLYWDEFLADTRWDHKSYSAVKYYNFLNKKSGHLTRKTRYYAPAVSPSGKLIAIVSIDDEGQNSLKLLNAENGQVESTFLTPNNAAIQTPKWDSTSQLLTMTMVNEKGKSLIIFNVEKQKWQTIVNPSYDNISDPCFLGNYIVFNASFSGIDNIYAVSLKTSQIWQITSAKYGAFFPESDKAGNSIIYSNYTAKGYNMVTSAIDTTQWIPLEKVKNISLNLADKLTQQEPVKFDTSKIQYKNFESKPYNKFSHLVNVHSWMPIYYNPNVATTSGNPAVPGYTIFTQNLLGTLSGTAGQCYYYGNLFSYADITYKGLYPVFEFYIQHGGDLTSTNNANAQSNEKSLFLAGIISQPLNLSTGSWISGLTPAVSYSYENKYYETRNNGFFAQGINSLAYSIQYYRYQNTSGKDIVPRIGLSTLAKYYQPIDIYNVFSPQGIFMLNTYIPGIRKHDAIKLSFNLEAQDLKGYFATDKLGAPRGYLSYWYYNSSIIKNMTTMSCDYIFPIAFPDITALKIFYIKRLNGSLFYEQANTNEYENKTFVKNQYKSVGIELSADFNMLFIPSLANLPYFRFGIRPSYLFYSRNISLEFFTNLSVF